MRDVSAAIAKAAGLCAKVVLSDGLARAIGTDDAAVRRLLWSIRSAWRTTPFSTAITINNSTVTVDVTLTTDKHIVLALAGEGGLTQ